jgi:hypothetical protein
MGGSELRGDSISEIKERTNYTKKTPAAAASTQVVLLNSLTVL